ncbi:DUF3370 family protein [Streptomyces sp. NPDC001914]|uniref:DUF3370 family protein n=1 Tax=Streptomyces sp. NPDC001914 TaxID=3364623 RepID=UPI0036D01BF2
MCGVSRRKDAQMTLQPSRRSLVRLLSAGLGGGIFALGTGSAQAATYTDQRSLTQSEDRTTAGFDESAWTPGAPTAPGPTVPREQLLQLPGALGGPEMVVSNNPETVTGPGWLMQHSRTSAARGGAARSLSGTFPLYLYHQNSTGGAAYLHVLASNPGATAVTVSARGAAWTNADKPLVQDPAMRAGTGPCYATSSDWLTGGTRVFLNPTQVASKKMVEVARLPMTGSILDGRLEITASSGVYTYAVVTTDGSTQTAMNLSQTDGAWAPGNIVSQTATTYGREAGVYGASAWNTGQVTLDVPAAGHHVGFAVNTTHRQVAALDQTAPATAALTDSSQRSWGNYGSWYNIDLLLRNNGAESRTVQLTFGSNVTGTTDVPGNTWNGAVAVSVDNAPEDIVTTYVRPTVPRDTLQTVTVATGQSRAVSLRFLVPGLITAGSQLLLESI